jgi:hypothetical protein
VLKTTSDTSKTEGRPQPGAPRRGRSLRLFGIIILLLAGFLAWAVDWFQVEKDVSAYPEIELTYTDCKFETVTHLRGPTTKQLVFITATDRYTMSDAVWRWRFDGPTLAAAFAGGGTVHAWVHPKYPHTLRGLRGGKQDIPPEWGLTYDQRNARVGAWAFAVMVLAGVVLLLWKRGGTARSAGGPPA